MEPLVSICCITYNHEKYIADALDSFLNQKASFQFEIIIHDDASTDNTPKIIRQYAEKYPDIIKPIYQKENQYAKGTEIYAKFIFPLVKGHYIATCEGDDYWIDHRKIEKQVRFLENNQDYIMCFHAVKIVDINRKFVGRYLGLFGQGSKKIDMKEVTKGGVVHVSSRLVRAEFARKIEPEWISKARYRDYAMALYMAAEGNVFYRDEVMSAYRIGVENSMMTNLSNNYSKKKDIEHQLNNIEVLEMADQYYDYRHHNDIEATKLMSQVIILFLKNNYSHWAIKKYKKYMKEYGFFSFVKLLILKKCPIIGGLLVLLKDKMIRFKADLANPKENR